MAQMARAASEIRCQMAQKFRTLRWFVCQLFSNQPADRRTITECYYTLYISACVPLALPPPDCRSSFNKKYVTTSTSARLAILRVTQSLRRFPGLILDNLLVNYIGRRERCRRARDQTDAAFSHDVGDKLSRPQ